MQKDLELYDKEESIKKLISFTSVKLKREMDTNIVVKEYDKNEEVYGNRF